MRRNEAWPRAILHVGLDAFHASVHQRDNPGLRGKPLVVAGRGKRAVVIGASPEAQAFGIQAGAPVNDAVGRCPGLTVVPPDHAAYRDASRQVQAILRRFTSPELIESAAPDEAYLDVTARTRHGTSSPEDVARRIKYAVHTEVGLTVSVGGGTSKAVAKIAGSIGKPDGLLLVPPGREAEFLAPLPIDVVPGLDAGTREKLYLIGMQTVGELARHDSQRLVQLLGSTAPLLQRLAQGRDRTPVVGIRPARTLSVETTFETDVVDPVELDQVLQQLVGRLAARLVSEGVRARTVSVKVKLPSRGLVNRQVSRTSPTDSEDVILRIARAALQRSHIPSQPIRLLGVAVSGLQHPQGDVQLDLIPG